MSGPVDHKASLPLQAAKQDVESGCGNPVCDLHGCSTCPRIACHASAPHAHLRRSRRLSFHLTARSASRQSGPVRALRSPRVLTVLRALRLLRDLGAFGWEVRVDDAALDRENAAVKLEGDGAAQAQTAAQKFAASSGFPHLVLFMCQVGSHNFLFVQWIIHYCHHFCTCNSHPQWAWIACLHSYGCRTQLRKVLRPVDIRRHRAHPTVWPVLSSLCSSAALCGQKAYRRHTSCLAIRCSCIELLLFSTLSQLAFAAMAITSHPALEFIPPLTYCTLRIAFALPLLAISARVQVKMPSQDS